MTFPPDLELNQNADLILARMKANEAMAGIDTSPPSPMNIALAPVSVELAEAYRQLEAMLWRNRLVGPEGQVAVGSDLDAVGDERGIYRLPGVEATGIVRFIGPAATVIPANTVVTTLGPNVRRFRTDHATLIPAGGEIDVAATALAVGVGSNVPSGAIALLEVPITRTRVTNVDPFTGGVDVENDDDYRARIVEFVRDPPNGSNPAQYRKWARDVPGVGGAITLRPGEPDAGPPGTVDLYLVDLAMLPASTALCDAVQNYIAPGREALIEDTAFTVQGALGVTTGVLARPGAVGSVVQMIYNATADGEIRHAMTSAQLIQAGNWQARIRAQTSATAGATTLMTLQVYNVTQGTVGQASAELAVGTATATFRANQMSLEWAYYAVPFYWNGSDTLRLSVFRNRTDTTTQLFIDSVTYHSLFSAYDREGLAPILDEVRVKPAVGRPIDVVAAIHVEPGYVWAGTGGVQQSVAGSIDRYLREVALANATSAGAAANDVIYGEVGASIQGNSGVDYYDPATLRVNGATVNVTVAKREVAVPGTYTLTQV
jgi:uncharacterized phage protein gp47/JayE